MSEFGFTDPWLLGLAVIPLMLPLLRRWPGFRKRGILSISSYAWLPASGVPRAPGRRKAEALRIAGLLCLVPVAAGIETGKPVSTDIVRPDGLVIVLDTSSSMTARDFGTADRLETAKQLLGDFISESSGVETGLIVLAASPRLMVPATQDRDALQKALAAVRPAGFGDDGTAIGSGIASAINRLRYGKWRERRILLVTDGVSNRGPLAAVDAARIAAGMNIRIDTVGIGTDSVSRFWVPVAEGPPVEVEARIEIDDQALTELARITGGSYARVTNAEQLRRALIALQPEDVKITQEESYRRDYTWIRFLAAACILFVCLEFVMRQFVISELPG